MNFIYCNELIDNFTTKIKLFYENQISTEIPYENCYEIIIFYF